MVAYKVVELGDEKYVFVYDNNDPMPIDPAVKEASNWVKLNSITNSFKSSNYPGGFPKAAAMDPIRDIFEIGPEDIFDVIKYLLRKQISANLISMFFSWNTDNPVRLISVQSLEAGPAEFMVTDQYGRRIGYQQGKFINEIPGAEFNDWQTGYFLNLPGNLQYSLTTEGNGSSGYNLALTIPLGSNKIPRDRF